MLTYEELCVVGGIIRSVRAVIIQDCDDQGGLRTQQGTGRTTESERESLIRLMTNIVGSEHRDLLCALVRRETQRADRRQVIRSIRGRAPSGLVNHRGSGRDIVKASDCEHRSTAFSNADTGAW